MTDRYDDAKRALEGVPAHDVWAEAERRAQDGTVVPLTTVTEPRRRPIRWIAGAAAAVVLLLAGAVAVRSGDDGDPVSAGPGSEEEVICGFTSAPIVTEGPSELLTERVGPPPPSVMHGVHPSDSGRDYPFEISSPADDGIVIGPEDAGGEISTRSFAIARGEATVIADDSVSQLTWAPAGASPCETFSVTVAGPPGDEMDGVLLSIADAITLTGPEGTPDARLTTYQADGGCKIGVAGEPLPEPVTVTAATDTVRVDEDGSPIVGTLITGRVNATQTYAVQSPSAMVIDYVGERTEEIQLRRGTATLWFGGTTGVAPEDPPAVNPVEIRPQWDDLGCASFAVRVAGGTEDENRHAAIDLTERVLVGEELEDVASPPSDAAANPLANTEWQLERATVDGEPTQGTGALFVFTDGHLTWTACNTFDASYTYDDEGLHVGAVSSTELPCPANPTTDAISRLMSTDPVGVTVRSDGLVELRAGDIILVLRPPVATDDQPSTTTTVVAPLDTTTLIGSRWVVSGVEENGQAVALPEHSTPVEFADEAIQWTDNCNASSTPVDYGSGTITVTGGTSHTDMGCPEDTAGDELIRAVLTSVADDPSAPPRSVERVGDTVRLQVGDKVVVLSPA